MSSKNPDVDQYIANAAPFAKPILKKLRSLFRRADKRLVEEIKWSCPSFKYRGLVGGFAAFKKHVSWGFWKASLMKDPTGAMKSDASSPMGGGKVDHFSQLPPDDVIISFVRQGIALNEAGTKNPKRTSTVKKPMPRLPADFASSLERNARARAAFAGFSPSHKREYIEWITEAKQPATRERRLLQAIEWIAEGKPRNWRYMNC